LLIGDQAFLHDLNSLSFLTALPVPVLVVLINNNGGRIFEHLPIGEHASALEPYFVAPHDLTFDRIVDGFGLPYARAKNREEFRQTLGNFMKSGRSAIIEAVVDARISLDHRREIAEAVQNSVESE
jgi:2-succinyl-5-enolpyruvyl-6-hydroxy-3-cyclohexene-1-carboxylate synthase